MTHAGVYQIVNTVNGRIYIGSSVNLASRRRSHNSALKRGDHENPNLQKEWRKYGANAFEWRVLLVCRSEDRLFYEQRCIDAFEVVRNGYNRCPNAGNGKGVAWSAESKVRWAEKKRGVPMTPAARANHAAAMGSPEVRAKLSKAAKQMSPERRARLLSYAISLRGKKRPQQSEEWWRVWGEKMSKALLGKQHSAERRANISAALRGKKRPRHSMLMTGRKLSLEHRAGIAAGLRQHSRRYELNGRSQTLAEWACEIGIPIGTIRKRIQRGVPLHLALTVKRFLKMPRNLKETA